jgi:hypothetical protein
VLLHGDFRIAGNPSTMPVRHHNPLPTAVSSSIYPQQCHPLSTHRSVILYLPTEVSSSIYPQKCHPERSEGSAVAFGSFKVALLPNCRQSNHNARSAPTSPTHNSVILNAVKDLQLLLRVSKRRNFRVGDHPTGTCRVAQGPSEWRIMITNPHQGFPALIAHGISEILR